MTPLQSVHIIEVDPLLYQIKLVRALDNGIGRESILSLSRRHGAIASINGGFFTMTGAFEGQSCGALKIQDWVALPSSPRGCIGWSSKNPTLKTERLLVEMQALYENRSFSIEGLNRPRKENEMILFTPCFNKTTLTRGEGEEIRVQGGLITHIVQGENSNIPDNGYVLSIDKKHPLYGFFEVGKPLGVFSHLHPQMEKDSFDEWSHFDYILGGGPLLIYQGAQITDFKPEKIVSPFLNYRRARTAVGLLENGNWVFVVIDKMGLFDGMTVYELQNFMRGLGCVEALNLDGGGSSSMVYQGILKNLPSGDEEGPSDPKALRLVSDAIIVLPK